MNEDSLIQQLTKGWKTDGSVIQGVGDDCAILAGCGANHRLLLKTDSIVEGRHFLHDTPAKLIGRKALARVLSDLAAMGGVPLHALVTLGIPPKFDLARLKHIYEGLTALAVEHGVNLVGGETTRSSDCFLSVAALGETRGYLPILRSGARVGDSLWVTGVLGNSLSGRHLNFSPRLKEGQWLARRGFPTAMMDLSDGLGSDLPRLAKSSAVWFELDVSRLPLSKGASWRQACTDGEDYELLFTVPIDRVRKMLKSWPFDTQVTEIGKIVPESTKRRGKLRLPHGFDHLFQPRVHRVSR